MDRERQAGVSAPAFYCRIQPKRDCLKDRCSTSWPRVLSLIHHLHWLLQSHAHHLLGISPVAFVQCRFRISASVSRLIRLSGYLSTVTKAAASSLWRLFGNPSEITPIRTPILGLRTRVAATSWSRVGGRVSTYACIHAKPLRLGGQFTHFLLSDRTKTFSAFFGALLHLPKIPRGCRSLIESLQKGKQRLLRHAFGALLPSSCTTVP